VLGATEDVSWVQGGDNGRPIFVLINRSTALGSFAMSGKSPEGNVPKRQYSARAALSYMSAEVFESFQYVLVGLPFREELFDFIVRWTIVADVQDVTIRSLDLGRSKAGIKETACPPDEGSLRDHFLTSRCFTYNQEGGTGVEFGRAVVH
jgi:hypothetical protein